MKQLMLTVFLLVVASSVWGTTEPRLNGIYKLGDEGAYEYDYIRLLEDKTMMFLYSFSDGDEEAAKVLYDEKKENLWNYTWEKKKLYFSKHHNGMHYDGDKNLTPNGIIENSVFLVIKQGKVVDKIFAEAKKTKYKCKLLKLDTSLLVPEEFDSCSVFEKYKRIIVSKNGKDKLIDFEGKDISNYEELIPYFSHGDYIPFYDGKFWGLLNINGKIIVEPKYQQIEEYKYGVIGFREKGKWILVDKNLKTILPFAVHRYFLDKSGLIAVLPEKGSKAWEYYTLDAVKLPYISKSNAFGMSYVDNLSVIETPKEFVIVNSEGKEILRHPLFADFTILTENRFLVADSKGVQAIIDSMGKNIVPPMSINMTKLGENLIEFKVKKAYGFMNMDGKVLVRAGYRSLKNLGGGFISLARFTKSSKKRRNYSLTKAEDLYDLSDGSLNENTKNNGYGSKVIDGTLTYYEGKNWGVISASTHKNIIPNEYYYISDLKHGLFLAETFGGKYKNIIFDQEGNKVFSSKYEVEKIISPDLVSVKKGNKMGVYSIKEKAFLLKPKIKNVNKVLSNGILLVWER